ncbi:grasp-with-spasm system ATP-grasp peptide maturase [Pedobacter sp. KBS0701]|uniref:grasp-with-spasm system ATP-grasp peptide maturase n=1 Tax=Pedobacter sp. KBS0701 TaxID=2578106 RepID=UPI00110F163A|nr:grasp-with-spasm system ATP-grasp peptide maturase [Pedobacter sp. KBS0701]QDW24735.1 grasp-with-spasm system ATP-grasp peptide maturase [Pedobacter sp. KBS0701]
MILIFTQNFEPSTDKVIEWLKYYNKPYIRVNCNTDAIKDVCFELLDEAIDSQEGEIPKIHIDKVVKKLTIGLTSGISIDLKTITSVWYRRGGMPSYDTSSVSLEALKSSFFVQKTREYMREEYDEIVRYIYFYLFENPRIRSLGNPYRTGSDKPRCLTIANLFGLKIPDMYITSNKSNLRSLLTKVHHSITKGISELFLLSKGTLRITSYTSNLDLDDVDKLTENFFPSLLQKKILKIADIRSVYFRGEFYSMAIFSQGNSKTDTDFRNYDTVTPNRNTPFKLPSDIEQKLSRLCKYLGQDFCSIDILMDSNYDFYFLEINPVGQFGMVSMPCNYYIEKKIANYL